MGASRKPLGRTSSSKSHLRRRLSGHLPLGEDGDSKNKEWSSETGRAWKELFQGLKDRGLTGVELVVSDAHEGLVRAIDEAFPGAAWQECQTHFMRRALESGA